MKSFCGLLYHLKENNGLFKAAGILFVCSISACTDEIILSPLAGRSGVGLEAYQLNEQWELIDTWHTLDTRICASNMKLYVHVRRKPRFFLMNVVLPIMILSAMTLTVFWLPPDSSEKISLAVTIVLSFSVFQLVVSNILPKTSESTPLLGNCACL